MNASLIANYTWKAVNASALIIGLAAAIAQIIDYLNRPIIPILNASVTDMVSDDNKIFIKQIEQQSGRIVYLSLFVMRTSTYGVAAMKDACPSTAESRYLDIWDDQIEWRYNALDNYMVEFFPYLDETGDSISSITSCLSKVPENASYELMGLRYLREHYSDQKLRGEWVLIGQHQVHNSYSYRDGNGCGTECYLDHIKGFYQIEKRLTRWLIDYYELIPTSVDTTVASSVLNKDS